MLLDNPPLLFLPSVVDNVGVAETVDDVIESITVELVVHIDRTSVLIAEKTDIGITKSIASAEDAEALKSSIVGSLQFGLPSPVSP